MTDKLRAAADQAISNVQAISNMTGDPHIRQIAHATANLLGAALNAADEVPVKARIVVYEAEGDMEVAMTQLSALMEQTFNTLAPGDDHPPSWYEHG